MKKFIFLAIIGMTGFFSVSSGTITQRLADLIVIDGLKHGLSASNLNEFLDQIFIMKYTTGASAAVFGLATFFSGLYLMKRIVSNNQESKMKAGTKTGLAAIISIVFGVLTGCSVLGYNTFDQILVDCRNLAYFSATVIRLIATYGKFN